MIGRSMISRRRFLCTVSLSVLAGPLPAEAQTPGNARRIGFVGGTAEGIRGSRSDAFAKGLGELGFTIGQNVTIEYRWLGGRLSPAPEVVADFIRTNVDVIVAYATPAVFSAKEATSSIPIVMVGPRDPVEQGIIATLARPGGNITGISSTAADPGLAAGKRLALIKEALPRVSRVGYLWTSKFPGAQPGLNETQRTAEKLKITVRSVDVAGPDELSSAFATMKRDGVEAVSVEAGLGGYHKRIIELAAASRLPAIYGGSLFVEQGGLMGYSPDWVEIFRKAGHYAGKVLNGAKPADLPVEQPTKFELLINLPAAKALGFTIPPSLLLRADRVIE
jgi:putative ABC transport system substrate-binding protein